MSETVYECKCEGQLFFLHQDGTVECGKCHCTFSDITVHFEDGWKIQTIEEKGQDE